MSDILIIFALILLNGVFSMSELALVSARRVRLEKLSHEGSQGARAAIELAEDPSYFLSTVQVGITLISIFNGAFGEASLVDRLAPQLEPVPGVGPYAREVALVIVVVAITFFSIIFGELVPKRIAIQYPEAMATWIAPLLRGAAAIMKPFVWMLTVTTEFIIRLLGMQKTHEDAPTEEEITGMIKESTDAGVFEKTEYDIISRALRLDDCHLRSLMTPRVDLELIDLEDKLDDNLEKIASTPYSRYPVYKRDLSQVMGIVHTRELFGQAIRSRSLDAIDIASAIKPVLYVPESVSGMDLLELFKKHRVELALVVDEYGDIQGMATLADVMSALVGDVPAIESAEEPDAVQREDGTWFLDAGMSLDRFRDLFDTKSRFPDESEGNYHTLAGFVLYQLGYIPRPSDHFEWDEFQFEIVDMDGNRIDRLLVSRVGSRQAPTEMRTG